MRHASYAAITANGTSTGPYKILQGLGTLIVSVTAIKEKGSAGSETGPGKGELWLKEFKVVNENEIEVVLASAPVAKTVYWVQIGG